MLEPRLLGLGRRYGSVGLLIKDGLFKRQRGCQKGRIRSDFAKIS